MRKKVNKTENGRERESAAKKTKRESNTHTLKQQERVRTNAHHACDLFAEGIVGITAEGIGAADAKPGHDRPFGWAAVAGNSSRFRRVVVKGISHGLLFDACGICSVATISVCGICQPLKKSSSE